MKLLLRSVAVAVAAMTLAGCATAPLTGPVPPEPISILPAPVTIGVPAPAKLADRTILDEQGLRGLELAYKATRLALETATDAGLVRGTTATLAARLDNAAYAALGVARGAYATGNAKSYAAALTEGRNTLGQLVTLIAGKG